MNINADVLRVIKPYIDEAIATATTAVYKGKGDDLPAAADKIGQLFVKTGATNPGVYIATGTTTPNWTLVANKNAE